MSVDVGCVRLTEAYLLHDPPQPEELTNAIGVAHDHLDDVLRAAGAGRVRAPRRRGGHDHHRRRRRAGLGTTTAIRCTTSCSPGAAEDVFRTLATEPFADRVHNPGLPAERPTSSSAAAASSWSCGALAADELLGSATDLLDGVGRLAESLSLRPAATLGNVRRC